MTIIEEIDNYIVQFVDKIRQGEGWIAKDDIYRQFTTMFSGFETKPFSREGLEEYLIEELSFYSGVEIR
jgi:hypothetical protein